MDIGKPAHRLPTLIFANMLNITLDKVYETVSLKVFRMVFTDIKEDVQVRTNTGKNNINGHR